MGELLLSRYLSGTSITVSSAGTKGLPMHPIDPSSARLLSSIGIDSSGFRSRRLTRQIAQEADLILCFEAAQRKDIVTIAPTAVRYTFVLREFAALCQYCAERGMVQGRTIQERLNSVISLAPMVRPMLPPSADIEDPHGKEFDKFRIAANQTNAALRTILTSMRKHYGVMAAPQRTQIMWQGLAATV